MTKATLYTDGGSRGNPGPAAIGFELAITDAKTVLHSEYIGETTNNQAEYRALLSGMKRATKEGVTDLECFLDSELVVKQVLGQYRVKDINLRPLYEEIVVMKGDFTSVGFQHVRREKNKVADGLVNEALDAKIGKKKFSR